MKPIYEDNQLVVNLINDDEKAFCILYAKYRRKLYLFALTFLKSDYVAEDIVQDVFTLIWEKRKFLDINASFQSYLYTITRNRVLNFIRDNTHKQFLEEIIYAAAIDSGDDTFDKVTSSELEHLLEQSIEVLTYRQKEVYMLSRKEGLSHQEIAKKLNISTGTVGDHITDALKAIYNHLKKHYDTYAIFLILSALIIKKG